MRKKMGMLAVGAIGFGLIVAGARAQSRPPSGFDRLKTLVGEWQSTSPKGEVFTNRIRLVSNGTALEEAFQSSEDDQMVTLYTRDGSRLALTHYCAIGNQPRMETPAVTADQSAFDFSFVGATNLANPGDAHMHHLVLQIADRDHFSETWTFKENDKERTETFHFTRKK
jgi:hypothetical protein